MTGDANSYLAFFAVTLVVYLIYLGVYRAFLKRLESHHPEVWNELGKPTLVLNNGIANGWATGKFILLSRYRALEDESLSRLGVAVKCLLLVGLVLFVVLVVLQPK